MVRQVCFYLKTNMQTKKETIHKYLIINILCKKKKKKQLKRLKKPYICPRKLIITNYSPK